MRLSRILLVPTALLFLLLLYWAWSIDETYAYWAVPLLVLGTIILVFSPQIDWWLWKRNPPKLSASGIKLLEQRFPFYQQLSKEEKSRFRDRLSLYLRANSFTAKSMPSVPGDFKAMLGAYAVQVGFGIKDHLFEPFEQIVLYPHPFPSPQFEELHTGEIHTEDGVVIVAAPYLARGFMEADKYFPTGLREYVEIYRHLYPPTLNLLPEVTDEDWPALERVAGFSRDAVTGWIGLKKIDLELVAMTYFFRYPDRFLREFPEYFKAYKVYFKA